MVTSTSAASMRGSESIQSSRNRGMEGSGSGRDVLAHPFLVDRAQRAVARQLLQDRVDLGDQGVLPLLHDHADGDVGGQVRVQDAEGGVGRSEEHTPELQSRGHLVCRLLLEKKNTQTK